MGRKLQLSDSQLQISDRGDSGKIPLSGEFPVPNSVFLTQRKFSDRLKFRVGGRASASALLGDCS